MKLRFFWAVVFIGGAGVGYFLSHPLVFNLCAHVYTFNNYTGCADDTIKSLGTPLLVFSMWGLLPTLMGILSPVYTLLPWCILATCFVTVAIVLMYLFPAHSSYLLEFNPIYLADVARVMGELFTVATLVLIIWKHITARRQKNKM